MLYDYMVSRQIHVMPYHLQSRVSQYLLKREYVSAINQEPRSKRVPAKVSMESMDS
jgi:hypothetical protein